MRHDAADYEFIISKKVFFVFTLLFSCLYAYSIAFRLVSPSPEKHATTVLILRIVGLILNLSGLIVSVRYRRPAKPRYAIGVALTFVNFGITRFAQLLQGLDQGNAAIIFSMSVIYVLFMGLFTRSLLPSLVFSAFLVVCYALVFFLFPGLFFRVPETMRQNTEFVTLISGNLLATLVVASLLTQSVTRSLYRKVRDNGIFLERLAYYDQDTGLPNGRLLDFAVAERAASHANESILLMGFRILGITNLNARIGYDETSAWIVSYANQLSERVADWYRRQGVGDAGAFSLYRAETATFFLWIPYPDGREDLRQNAPAELSRIITSLLEGNEHRIRLDFGGAFAIYPDDADDPGKLQKMALGVLHQTKNAGSNRFVPYNASDFLKYRREEELVQWMSEPAFASQLRGVFQPKVLLESARCMGFEALIRWNRPGTGNVPPGEFVRLAETTHAIETLTWAILGFTDRFVAELREQGAESIRVSVNLSPALITKEWLASLRDWIVSRAIGRYLELEITEGILFNATPEIEVCFDGLRRTGVSFSIDDFGTGYSNLSYLQSFKAECLKLDKRFVDELPGNRKDADLVNTIIHIASIFGMKTVIEGVEREDQIEYLKTAGCDIIQGYYFSRPLEKGDAIAYFRRHGGAEGTQRPESPLGEGRGPEGQP